MKFKERATQFTFCALPYMALMIEHWSLSSSMTSTLFMLGVRQSLGLWWGTLIWLDSWTERHGCEENINDMDSFNDLIRDLGLIDILLGGVPFLGLISEPHPLLQSLIGSLSWKLGMIPFFSPLIKLSQTPSPITYTFSSIPLIDSTLEACS